MTHGIATIFRGRLRHHVCVTEIFCCRNQPWRLVDPVRFTPAALTSIPSPQGEADASGPGEGRRTNCKSRLNVTRVRHDIVTLNIYVIMATKTGPHAVSTILPIA